MCFIEKIHGPMHAPIAKYVTARVHRRLVEELEADGTREGRGGVEAPTSSSELVNFRHSVDTYRRIGSIGGVNRFSPLVILLFSSTRGRLHLAEANE